MSDSLQIDESIQQTVNRMLENDVVEGDDFREVENELYRKFMDEPIDLPDLNAIPDFSEIEEKINEKRSRFSNVKAIAGQPVIFTHIFVTPQKFSDNIGHKCLIHCITINDNKRHAIYSCSGILSRQFSDIYNVLYNKRVTKKERFHINKPFKGVINSHLIPGKNATYLKLSTTIQTEETKDVSSNTVSESTAART